MQYSCTGRPTGILEDWLHTAPQAASVPMAVAACSCVSLALFCLISGRAIKLGGLQCTSALLDDQGLQACIANAHEAPSRNANCNGTHLPHSTTWHIWYRVIPVLAKVLHEPHSIREAGSQ